MTAEHRAPSASQSAQKKGAPRGRASKTPPYDSIDGSLQLIKMLYESGGGEMSDFDLANALSQSHTSSRYQRRLSSAKNFGLINGENKRVSLTELGQRILEPTEEGSENRLKTEALTQVPEFKSLLDFYEGKPLPAQQNFMENKLGDICAVPKEKRSEWVIKFIENCRTSNIIQKGAGGKEFFIRPVNNKRKINDSPGGADGEELKNPPIVHNPPPLPARHEGTEIMRPLQLENGSLVVLVPESIKPEEAEKIKKYLLMCANTIEMFVEDSPIPDREGEETDTEE